MEGCLTIVKRTLVRTPPTDDGSAEQSSGGREERYVEPSELTREKRDESEGCGEGVRGGKD